MVRVDGSGAACNNKRGEQSDAIAAKKHPTGETFHWTVEYIKFADSQLFVMENPRDFVKGAKDPAYLNFQRQAENVLNGMGWSQAHDILLQEHYGDSGNRDRFHMSVWQSELSTAERDMLFATMECFKVPQLPMRHYIRPAHLARADPWMTTEKCLEGRIPRSGPKELKEAVRIYRQDGHAFPPFHIYSPVHRSNAGHAEVGERRSGANSRGGKRQAC